MDFLLDNDVPKSLRAEIIQWTRFLTEHDVANVSKKQMINELPDKLQRDLVRHLYSASVLRVPLFKYLETIVKDEAGMTFLGDLWLLLEYSTYTLAAASSTSASPRTISCSSLAGASSASSRARYFLTRKAS